MIAVHVVASSCETERTDANHNWGINLGGIPADLRGELRLNVGLHNAPFLPNGKLDVFRGSAPLHDYFRRVVSCIFYLYVAKSSGQPNVVTVFFQPHRNCGKPSA